MIIKFPQSAPPPIPTPIKETSSLPAYVERIAQFLRFNIPSRSSLKSQRLLKMKKRKPSKKVVDIAKYLH